MSRKHVVAFLPTLSLVHGAVGAFQANNFPPRIPGRSYFPQGANAC